MSSLKRNMIFNTVGGLWYQGCLWLITVLVVRLSTNYEYSGMLALGMTVGNMMSALGTFNVRIYQITDVLNKFSQSEYVAFRMVSLVTAAFLLLLYAVPISDSAECYLSILAYLAFKIDESFVDVIYGIDQRHGRMDYIGISQAIRGSFVACFFTVCMLLFNSLPIALILMTLPCIAVTILYDLKVASKFEHLKPRISAARARALLLDCLPLAVSVFLLGMIVSISRQIYGCLDGVESLGIYAAVATPAVLVQAGARFLYSPLIVPLCDSFYENIRGFKTQLKSITIRFVMISVVSICVFGLVGPFFLNKVFGSSIGMYTDLFWGVLFCSATSALLYFISDVLVLCRFVGWNCIVSITSFCCALAFSFLFVPLFDMDGINISIVMANSVGIIFCYVVVARMLKEKCKN